MRITYLCLENYIGIYNGLGLDKIEVDLSKAKHKICLIAGPNGVGKSTIIGALHVLPDSNTSFIANRTARKLLSIMDGEIGYNIQIISNYNNGKRTNEAYISKNGQELNPNGNITSYKDIVFAEFDIDSNFIAMSKISSEDRGLADKTPSERKKLIASRIESLDVYNEMYRTLNKKANIFKSHLNSIASKLQNLGSKDDLELRLVEIQKSEYAITASIEDNKKHLIEAETEIKLLDSDGGLWDHYAQIREQLTLVSTDAEAVAKDVEELSNSLADEPHVITITTSELSEKVNEKEKEIERYKGEKDQIIAAISSIDERIEDKKFQLQKVEDQDIESSIYQTSVKAKEEKERELNSLAKEFKQTKNIFSDRADILANSISIDTFKKILIICEDLASVRFDTSIPQDQDKDVVEMIAAYFHETGSDLTGTIETIAKATEKSRRGIDERGKLIIELTDEVNHLTEYIDDLDTQLEGFNTPGKCKSLAEGKCSLLDHYRQLENKKDELVEKYRDIDWQLGETKNEQECSEFGLEQLNIALERLKNIKAVCDYIRFYKDTISELLSDDKICIWNTFLPTLPAEDIQCQINNLVDLKKDLADLYNYIVERARLVTGIQTINSTLEKHQAIVDSMQAIKDEIESLKSEQCDLLKKKDSLLLKIETSSKLRDDYMKKLTASRELDRCKIIYETLLNKINAFKAELANIDKSGVKIADLKEKVDQFQAIIDTGMERLREVSEEKKRIESQILIWDNFQSEYAEYNEKYNYVNILRKYSSPTQGGIQSLYMSLYMNKTLDTSNQILSMLFEGQYKILDYIINETEFRIPFIGSGMIVDDISSGSTSQKCIMGSIISLVSNSSASPIYNIASLDEVDSGLDQSNRMIFADTILKASDILGIAQLFSISHSIESSINNVDVILLSDDQNYIDQFANSNIIYLYKKEAS